MTGLRYLLPGARECLRKGPHPDRARLDAELLLLHVLGRDKAWLLAHADDELSDDKVVQFLGLIERRYLGEPIQYITGEQEFFGLPLRVTPAVLIPRPETEHLVEKALDLAAQFNGARILDVGTGSGAIAVALAHKLPDAQVTAVDISVAALDVARENAQRNGVTERIRFVEGDLLPAFADERFEIVVSNPPYVPATDGESLSVEVRDHEPALALFAGDDGLDVYRRLIPAAHAALVPGGFIALEIGYGQSDAVTALLARAGFERIEFVNDLQDIARVASARKSSMQAGRSINEHI